MNNDSNTTIFVLILRIQKDDIYDSLVKQDYLISAEKGYDNAGFTKIYVPPELAIENLKAIYEQKYQKKL